MLRFCLLALGIVLMALAQAPTATVTGRVTDSSGGVIPGVSVLVRNLDTNQTQQTESSVQGEFTVPFIPPGRYAIEANSKGFRAFRAPEVSLAVGQI